MLRRGEELAVCSPLPGQVSRHGCRGARAGGKRESPFANSFLSFIEASNKATCVLKGRAGFLKAQQKYMGSFRICFHPNAEEKEKR